MWIGLLEACESHEVDHLLDAVLLLLVDAAGLEAKGDVLLDREPRVEIGLLEDEAAVVRRAIDLFATVGDGAVLGLVETGDQA